MENRLESLKRRAAERAVEFVNDGDIVGIGTGSTVLYAIQALGKRVERGDQIIGVPTSKQSEKLARDLNIPIRQLNEVASIDLVIDGADEIDADFNMIKGGGGALTREKLVALSSRRHVIVVDETKIVSRLGKKYRLPVEVLSFAWRYCQNCLLRLGCSVHLRTRGEVVFETDNGNYILDCDFDGVEDAAETERRIKLIPGVIESGLFIGLADTLVIGYDDRVEVRNRADNSTNSGTTPEAQI